MSVAREEAELFYLEQCGQSDAREQQRHQGRQTPLRLASLDPPAGAVHICKQLRQLCYACVRRNGMRLSDDCLGTARNQRRRGSLALLQRWNN